MIRFSQIILPTQDSIPADTTNPNFSYDKGGNIIGEGGNISEFKIKEIKDKLEKAIQKLSPDIRQNIQSQYNSIISQSSNIYQPLVKLYENVTGQVQKQQIVSLEKIKTLGAKLDHMSLIGNQDFYSSLNQIFQDYLKVEMSDEFISRVNLGNDLKEIVRFFVNNATDPKYNKVKQIFKNLPVNKWIKITDLITILICFYLNFQLNKMIGMLEKYDESFSGLTAISLIQSKLATNSMKIGIALNNLVNNNLLGQLLGQLASTALYGIEKFQDATGTYQSIGELINSIPTSKIR